jgi:hypothetical protein
MDRYLGEQLGEATREEVVEALGKHEWGTVVVELELPGGTSALKASGAVISASLDDGNAGSLIDNDGALMTNYHVLPGACW